MNNKELCEKLFDIHARLSESVDNLTSCEEWDRTWALEHLERNLLKLEELIDEIDDDEEGLEK